jgi:hypothetical protein
MTDVVTDKKESLVDTLNTHTKKKGTTELTCTVLGI